MKEWLVALMRRDEMNGVLGHDSALQSYTGLEKTWANEMNFVMKHAPGAGSGSVNEQSYDLVTIFFHLINMDIQQYEYRIINQWFSTSLVSIYFIPNAYSGTQYWKYATITVSSSYLTIEVNVTVNGFLITYFQFRFQFQFHYLNIVFSVINV